MYDHSKYAEIPELTLFELDRYAQDGIPPNRFCERVLINDLKGALAAVDVANEWCIPMILRYVAKELPAGCHGSIAAVIAWLKTFQEQKPA